ncbi:MAG TPA: xanthine phosphoribosyltransferase [Anaerolineae bacterium]|jgi:xanthine phosphoribosyltransferase
MRELNELLIRDSVGLGHGLLKVDSFLNHQINPGLLKRIGEDLAEKLAPTRPTRVLTVETSGIAPALMTALALNLPLTFARKSRTPTMPRNALRESTLSSRQERVVDLFVSPEYLSHNDRVVIIEDFLASAQTMLALARLVQHSGAELVAFGAVIEKVFEGGRAALEALGVPVVAVAIVEKIQDGHVFIREN